MATVMRLSRAGRNKAPFYHVVVTDSRNPRDGRYIERLGYYNPFAKEGEIKFFLKEDRTDYWAGVGAKAAKGLSKVMVDEGKGPQKLRDEFSKKKAARILVKKDDLEAAAKVKAEAAAAKEAEQKAVAKEAKEAAEAEAKATAEAAAAEAKEAEAAVETATEEAPAEEVKPEAKTEDAEAAKS